MILTKIFFFYMVVFFSSNLNAEQPKLNEKLEQVRTQRLQVEKALLDAEKTRKTTEAQLTRLKSLQKLQSQEKDLTEKRLKELEKYLAELQSRREDVLKRMASSQISIRAKISKLIHPLMVQNDQLLRGDATVGERKIKEQVLSKVTLSELKGFEILKADLDDADEIESRIEQERQQISSLMQDISEQESLILFHKKIRENLTKEKHEEHMKQLEEYRKLKISEVEIERMISMFQERQKLEKSEDQKKNQPFVSLKPRSLPWPLKGKLSSSYGQHLDEKTGLKIFKKGIEILTVVDGAEVISVLDGKVQFSGEIPGKGKVVIVEHPHSTFSIYGGLRDVLKSMNDSVKASEKLGAVAADSPLYFEIRVRAVAIDPVKWLQ